MQEKVEYIRNRSHTATFLIYKLSYSPEREKIQKVILDTTACLGSKRTLRLPCQLKLVIMKVHI